MFLTWNTFICDISHLAWVWHYLDGKFIHDENLQATDPSTKKSGNVVWSNKPNEKQTNDSCMYQKKKSKDVKILVSHFLSPTFRQIPCYKKAKCYIRPLQILKPRRIICKMNKDSKKSNSIRWRWLWIWLCIWPTFHVDLESPVLAERSISCSNPDSEFEMIGKSVNDVPWCNALAI